jgi:hypothetical protein
LLVRLLKSRKVFLITVLSRKGERKMVRIQKLASQGCKTTISLYSDEK